MTYSIITFFISKNFDQSPIRFVEREFGVRTHGHGLEQNAVVAGVGGVVQHTQQRDILRDAVRKGRASPAFSGLTLEMHAPQARGNS